MRRDAVLELIWNNVSRIHRIESITRFVVNCCSTPKTNPQMRTELDIMSVLYPARGCFRHIFCRVSALGVLVAHWDCLRQYSHAPEEEFDAAPALVAHAPSCWLPVYMMVGYDTGVLGLFTLLDL